MNNKTNTIVLTDRNAKTYTIDVCSSIKAPVCFAIDKVRKSCLLDGYNPSFVKARKVS